VPLVPLVPLVHKQENTFLFSLLEKNPDLYHHALEYYFSANVLTILAQEIDPAIKLAYSELIKREIWLANQIRDLEVACVDILLELGYPHADKKSKKEYFIECRTYIKINNFATYIKGIEEDPKTPKQEKEKSLEQVNFIKSVMQSGAANMITWQLTKHKILQTILNTKLPEVKAIEKSIAQLKSNEEKSNNVLAEINKIISAIDNELSQLKQSDEAFNKNNESVVRKEKSQNSIYEYTFIPEILKNTTEAIFTTAGKNTKNIFTGATNTASSVWTRFFKREQPAQSNQENPNQPTQKKL